MPAWLEDSTVAEDKLTEDRTEDVDRTEDLDVLGQEQNVEGFPKSR